MDVLRQALKAVAAGQTVVLATVVEADGSVPRGPGARMLIPAGGATVGSKELQVL